MATLTGNLADVTNKAPENISSITVKAPAARIGGSSGSSVIVTSPATVDFNSSTGNITISNLTGGLSWLYIEGDGWADSIGLAVADGMVTLVEAVANALGMPGIVDYIRLLADLEGRIEDVAQGAVDAAAENIKWVKRALTEGEDLNTVVEPGLYTVRYYSTALSLVNSPDVTNAVDRSVVEILESWGGAVQQTWYPMGVASRTDMPVLRRRRDTAGTWTEWERINAFTPAKESYIMQSISAAKWEKRAFVRDEDLNDITTAGVYYAPSYTVANSLVNNPVQLSRSAIDRAKIEVAATGSYISQIWTTIPSATKAAETVERHRDPTGEWSEWAVYGGGAGDEDEPAASFETLGLASHGMEGEHVGTRSLLRDLSGEESPVWAWWAPAPTSELEMPTHDGGGQTCHPSVLYFPNGWGGWKYWMAHTPYPNFKEAHEDPNIAVSDDGVNWQVPNGVTNPLDDGLGRPNYHNSDTHLAMWGNTMVLTWRTVDRPNGGQNIIYARTSQNGVTWTPKVEVLKLPLGTNESTFVSQSLVKMSTGWRLYGIRSNYAPNRLGYYETSVETLPKTSDWGAAKDCDLGEIPTGRDPWHSEVQRLSANDWVAVISDGRRGSTGVDGDIYLARSTDGVKWDVSPMPLTPRNNGVINSLYKTGFVVHGSGASRRFDLWVSGYRTDKRTWAVYRTRAEYRGSNQAGTLPVKRVGTGSPEGKVAAPVGSVYTDTAATNGSVRWIKVSGTGTTGWRDDYAAIAGATHQVGRADTNAANKLVKLDENGKLYISRHSIVGASDPVNKIYVDQRTPIEAFAGTGSPEGSVTAPVGSAYTDTAATNGAIRWAKASGTGNTGWRVEYGDTGIRDITGLIEGDTGGGTARIQRIGKTVMLALYNIPIPGDGSFMTIPNLIPAGFRSAFNWQYLGVSKPAGIDASGPLRVGTSGELLIYRSSSETQIRATVTYISDTPWPTTLPGTPA